MTDHCFISYSTADGLEFTRRLADELESSEPQIPAWYDKRDIPAGVDWDDQIVEAIKTCKCLLFVMSDDSTKPGSDCKNEILFALRYKKPILPIRLQKSAQPIFVLAAREWIDFTDGFKAGLPKLRKYVRELELPEGIIRALNERLTDAEHDLRRAKGEEENRIKVEIEELKAQIQVQQKILDDPDAAKAQTQKNIETGLERERQPEKPTAAQTSTKFINPPPGIAPNWFQDRMVETKQIVDFLNDDAQRLMTIVGRGGVGKTAMVCRLLKGLEGGELPDGLGRMRVEGIVYLSESGSHRVNFANLFYDLCKLLPSDAANELDAIYKNPQGSTESKMRALLEKFGGGRVVALLDNFEPLVDTESFAIRDAELDEALRAFLNGTHSAVKVVITTRVAPRALNLIQPGRQRGLTLDEGLESPYAENILREMDSDGRLGLKSAGAEALNRARIKTRGFPRALEALFAILASDRYTTLDELLVMPLPENVVEALVGEAFNRLDTNAQKVMQALAVYNRPVTPAAVDYLLAPHLPAMDSAPILQRLANMHFARKESGRFYLHPVDREFAFGLIGDGRLGSGTLGLGRLGNESSESEAREPDSQFTNIPIPNSRFTQHDLTTRAADYFAQARKPRAEWKKLEDLSAQLAEFDLRCAAGDYDSAANVLREVDYKYLLLWGHYRLLIKMRLGLTDYLHDNEANRYNDLGLGRTYDFVGQYKESKTWYEKGLYISEKDSDKIAFLWGLGNVSGNTGEIDKSISYFEQALSIAQKNSDKFSESGILSGLGVSYATLGNAQKAIEYHEQALDISRETGNLRGEAYDLGFLASNYETLGQIDKAIEFQEKSLTIKKGMSNKEGEGTSLSILGSYFSNLGDYKKAKSYFEESLEIAHQTGYRYGEGFRFLNLAKVEIEFQNYKKAAELALQSAKIGDEISMPHLQSNSYSEIGFIYLLSKDFESARKAVEHAYSFNAPDNLYNVFTLHGIIALRQGGEVTARGAFVRAIGQADEILSKTAEYYDALDAKGLALCGLLICDLRLGRNVGAGLPGKTGDLSDGEVLQDMTKVSEERPARTAEAIETFKKARKIAPHAGVVKSVLRLFDELAKCDTEGILKDVRKAAEGIDA